MDGGRRRPSWKDAQHKDSRTSTEFGAERSQLKAAMDL